MAEALICRVCGEGVEQSNSAPCSSCDERFHLRLRNDVDGRDCGEVWIDEQYLSLRYACFACLRGEGSQTEPPIGEGH